MDSKKQRTASSKDLSESDTVINLRHSSHQCLNEVEEHFGVVPDFMRKLPESAVLGAWEEIKGIYLNPDTALSAKTKDLIGLAIDSQIPCQLSFYMDREFARADGISEQEAMEAVGVAAIVRHWSAFLNGIQMEETTFSDEVNKIIKYVKNQMERTPSQGVSNFGGGLEVMGGSPEAVYKDIEKTLGSIPTFLKLFPKEGIVGAWKEMKFVQFSPETYLSPKIKELIGLAVSAQIPCQYCTYFHKQAALLHGATDREIYETLSLSGLTRHWSAVFNGAGLDEANFRSQVERLVEFSSKKIAA